MFGRLRAPTDAEGRAIRWFHSMDLGGGYVTDGFKSVPVLQAEADAAFCMPLNDKSVLDVGAWDGFFSFEAERRGAREVLAVDRFCWSGAGWGTKAGFDFARRRLRSKVRSLEIDIPDISPKTVGGTYDVVLFLGVLYHLKDPYPALERMASVTDYCLVIETLTALNDLPEPALRYFFRDELNHDASNMFGPNLPCVEQMLKEVGFRQVVARENPNGHVQDPAMPITNRHVIHAYK